MICIVCKNLLNKLPYQGGFVCTKCNFEIYYIGKSIYSASFKTNLYKLNIFFGYKKSFIFDLDLELICTINDIVFIDVSVDINSQIENYILLS